MTAEYIRTGTLPGDLKQAHKVRVQAARFTLIGGTCTSDPSQDLTLMPRAFRGPACSHSAYAISNVEINFRPMAFCAVGHGYSGTPPSSACSEKFLLVATDYFSKWVELKHMLASKTRCHQHRIQEFLFGAEHPEFILHTAISSKQWASRSYKQDPNHCLKEKA
ncbi:hypothetical protein CK203_005059 [Vitis vinifera]|uniref:Uncharacterized protein n=1 Tax=Vitis vinifera TaxID=29760 RepID=A0A438KEK7_VITVI|nr:hypothetical protein CK203_005059 [Vitis vinifera]